MDARLSALSRRFVDGARWFTTSPLHRHLCRLVADDEQLLALAAACRPGPQPTMLLLAAVHYLVLLHPEEELAKWYPSVVGDRARPPETVQAAFHSFCERHREELLDLVGRRLVQTNVVARAAALRLGLAVVARDLRDGISLVEVGASAGILLCFDRYRYEVGGRLFGDPAAVVTVRSEWRGDAQLPDLDRLPQVIRRIGVDLEPVDITNADARLWLRALVWPENLNEAALLEGALRIVASDPPRIVRGDAIEVLPQIDDELPADQPLVVFHAATRAHVPEDRRARFDEAIDHLGRRRPLLRLVLEASELDLELPELGPYHLLTLERVTRDRRQTQILAAVDGHAAWMRGLDVAERVAD